jgi:hypothetical protein
MTQFTIYRQGLKNVKPKQEQRILQIKSYTL